MSQNAERAKAIKLAGKLINNNGRTEGEVEQAMTKLSQILNTFNLTINDVVLANADYQTIVVEAITAKGCPMQSIVCAIGSFTDTKVWRTPGKTKWVRGRTPRGYSCMKSVPVGPATYNFFGIYQDVQYAEFLYNLVRDSLATAEVKFKKSPEYLALIVRRGQKKSALVSFRSSYVRRLSYRLNEMRREMEKDIREQDRINGGTDIVSSKSAARSSKFDEMHGFKLVSSKSHRTGGNSHVGYGAGRESANNVNLSRPMGNTSCTLALT